MLHSLHHLLHPFKVLWTERNELFWPIWVITTVLFALLVICAVQKKQISKGDLTPAERRSWSQGDVLALTSFVLLLACYIVGSLIWEDFTYYDNSYFTDGTLIGRDIPLQLLYGGRFFPLGHQEYNLIRHFTTSVIGYHSLRIFLLVLLCGILLFFNDELSVKNRIGLVLFTLITPSLVISFSGLIYPEWNEILCLLCLVFSMKRFERTQSTASAVATVICSQLMLYYKETAFVILVGFAAGRLLLRCWGTNRSGWDFSRVRSPESRLDICLLGTALWFLLYYLAAMYPNYSTGYAEESRLTLLQVVTSYVKLDLLTFVFALVVLARMASILRRKVEPELLWDSLALGGVGCLCAYLTLRIYSGYYLAPVDMIAILYLGRLTALSIEDFGWVPRVCLTTLIVLIAAQNFSLSAFRIYERKNVIHGKVEIGQAIKSRFDSDPQTVKRMFFPFAKPFHVMEFVAYLNYVGVPVEQVHAGGLPSGSVQIVGGSYQVSGPCGYRAFLCHPGNQPIPGDLVVVLPDDFTRADEWNLYRKQQDGASFIYDARPPIPRWLMPLVAHLHVVSPIFSQDPLPESWLKGSVTVWR
jgi:hypothetical protein